MQRKIAITKKFCITWSPSKVLGDRTILHNMLVHAKTAIDAWRSFKKNHPDKQPIGCIETYR